MPLFKDDKDNEKLVAEVKEYAETLHKLSDEVKMLRKEVEFLSSLAKRNEEKLLKHDKEVADVLRKFSSLLKILELDAKDL